MTAGASAQAWCGGMGPELDEGEKRGIQKYAGWVKVGQRSEPRDPYFRTPSRLTRAGCVLQRRSAKGFERGEYFHIAMTGAGRLTR